MDTFQQYYVQYVSIVLVTRSEKPHNYYSQKLLRKPKQSYARPLAVLAPGKKWNKWENMKNCLTK